MTRLPASAISVAANQTRESRADHNYVCIACHRMIPHALEIEARGVCRGQRQFQPQGTAGMF